MRTLCRRGYQSPARCRGELEGTPTMRLVSFAVNTPVGPARRFGAVLDGEPAPASSIVDLTTSYCLRLRAEGEPRWQEIGTVALPPDMQTFLEGGTPAEQRARDAIAFAVAANADITQPAPHMRLTFRRDEVTLLAPLPRP